MESHGENSPEREGEGSSVVGGLWMGSAQLSAKGWAWGTEL